MLYIAIGHDASVPAVEAFDFPFKNKNQVNSRCLAQVISKFI